VQTSTPSWRTDSASSALKSVLLFAPLVSEVNERAYVLFGLSRDEIALIEEAL
jgi:hypothetical protein